MNDLTFRFPCHRYPPPPQQKEGIPDQLLLREWESTGGEILLAGEAFLDPEARSLKLKFHLFDLVEGKHLTGRQYEGSFSLLRYLVHRMADETILQLTGERGVHTTKIAYTVAQGKGKEIFVADFDGADVKQITQNQSINLSPAWTRTIRRLPLLLTSSETPTFT
jgi:TolB protein